MEMLSYAMEALTPINLLWMTIGSVVGALLGVLVYHESVTLYKLAGIAAILAAVLLMNGKGRKR